LIELQLRTSFIKRQNSTIIQSAIFNIQYNAGADERIRTADLLITNQLLYQLSYVGLEVGRSHSFGAGFKNLPNT
jgi:hypothetical protein